MSGEIEPAELERLLEDGEPVRVVDIRSAAAFEAGHIPGSENVPFEELTHSIEDFAGEMRIVTVCPHGKASIQAARLIESFEGVPKRARVESLAGGLDAWEGPIVSTAADTTR